jgi:hypothetical protein
MNEPSPPARMHDTPTIKDMFHVLGFPSSHASHPGGESTLSDPPHAWSLL